MIDPASSAYRGAKWTVLAMLVITCALLGLGIYHGWLRLLSGSTSAAPAIAMAIAAIALLLAKLIGGARAEALRQADITGERPSRGWLVLAPILLAISALGLINLAFYHFEGQKVLQQVIDDAQANLAQLGSTAHARLRDAAQDDRRGKVEGLLSTLKHEIEHPAGSRHCGVGPAARTTMARIRAYLPDFTEMSASDATHLCAAGIAPAVYTAYEEQAHRLLENDEGFVKRNGPAREAFLLKLDAAIAKSQTALAASELQLTNSVVGQREDAYQGARTAIENAADVYGDGRDELDSLLAPQDSGLPAEIDIAAARNLGSITNIFAMLARRALYFSTYVYLALAIGLDFFLIYLFTQAHGAFGPPVKSGQRRSPPAIHQDGPRLLWVNQQ